MQWIIFEDLDVADTFFKRLKGLEGKTDLPLTYGLLFPKCKSVHMKGMRIPLDVLYFDGHWNLLGTETLEPGSWGHAPRGTRHTLECRMGTASRRGLKAGDKLAVNTCELGRYARRVRGSEWPTLPMGKKPRREKKSA